MLDALLLEQSISLSGWYTVVGVGVRTIPSLVPTLPKIADFLLWLKCFRKLSVSAVMGYRSMLSSVFRFKLPEISTSSVFHDILQSFQVEAPPSWDLNKVLEFLRSSTYEPLQSLSLRNLSKKVFFFL